MIRDWATPFETLRKKWETVPLGSKTRASSIDLLGLPDDDLLKVWLAARAEQTKWEERGWFESLYTPLLAGQRVLDIGCGLAFDSLHFAQFGAQVTCVDIVKTNALLVKRLAAMLDLPVEAIYMETPEQLKELGEYDVILALGSLHHAPPHIIKPEVNELCQHLVKDGRWLQLAYPKRRWLRNGCLPFNVWGEITDGKGTPYATWYDAKKLKRLLEPCRFDLMFTTEFADHQFVWFDMVKR